MGRRSSFSSSRSSSKPSSRTSTTTTAPRPAQPTPTAPAQTQSPGLFGSMVGTMFQGMAFGAGSEVAHQAVRGVMGGNSHQAQAQPADAQMQAQPQAQSQTSHCQMENTNFIECLKFNSNNIQACQDYLNLLKTCESSFK